MTVLRVLFWLWVIGSLAILVYRRTRRSETAAGSTSVVPARLDPATWVPPPLVDPSPEETPPPMQPPGFEDQPLEHQPLEDTRPPVHATPLDPDRTAAPLAGSSGATLAELLAGIALPHGLVPLTQFGAALDPSRQLVVATELASADAVRESLADELRELGYTVVPTGEHTAMADGPRGRVRVAVHPDPQVANEAGTPRFPTAGEGMVVVELTTD